MSEQILNRFFLVFYKNFHYFKSTLVKEDWNEFLLQTEIAINKYRASEKTKNDEKNLHDNLRSALRNFNFDSDIQNLLDSVITKAAETKQKESRPVKSVQNSIQEIAKKIEEEKKSRNKSKPTQ